MLFSLLTALALAGPRTPLTDYDANVARGLSPVPGTLAVLTAPGTADSALDAQIAPAGCAVHHRWGRSAWFTITCDRAIPTRTLVAGLAQQPVIVWVEGSFPVHLTRAPSDLVPSQWHHRNTGQTIGGQSGVSGADIGSVVAWDTTIGDPGAVVAVIDTGVMVDHTELSARIWQNSAEICGNAKDDDKNGYIDDCEGWDPADDDNDPDPRKLPAKQSDGRPCVPFHGTFIAGLVAGAGDNGSGGTGVLWDGRIMPIKMAADADCGLVDTALAEGIRYAVDNGARVINASWAYSGTSMALDAAYAEVGRKGVLLVIAAGNDNKDVDGLTTYPVDARVPNDLVVAATTHRDVLASFSNYGAEDVDIAAPGQSVWSTGIGSTTQHVEGSGTSFAAPLVAGGAALLWSQYPELRASEIRASLLEGGVALPALDCARGARCVASGRRLYLPDALLEAEVWATTPQIQIPEVALVDIRDGDGDRVVERGERIDVVVGVRNAGHAVAAEAKITLVVSHPHAETDLAVLDLGALAADTTTRPTTNLSFRIGLPCLEDGAATLTLRAWDEVSGASAERTLEVPVFCNIDEDGDGFLYPEDCDDLAPEVFPGAVELCNGVDDNCDDGIDVGAADAPSWPIDADVDGFGTDPAVRACVRPPGHATQGGDCDDQDRTTFPGAPELCDGADNDCDDLIDESPQDGTPLFRDVDGDGFGSEPLDPACAAGEGSSASGGDCDDDDPRVYPGASGWNRDCARAPCGCAHSGSATVFGPAGWALALGLFARRRPARA